jgi:hypothetical protein
MTSLRPPLSPAVRRAVRTGCGVLGWKLLGHLSPQLDRSVVVLHPSGGRMARWIAVATGWTSPQPRVVLVDPSGIPRWERLAMRWGGVEVVPVSVWPERLQREATTDSSCIQLLPGHAPTATEWSAWMQPFHGRRWWVVPVGIDRRRRKVHLHHGFHWGPYEDRNVHYVQRYFRYFQHPQNPER